MNTLTKKTLGLSLLCGLMLVGCNDKQPKPESTKADTKTEVKSDTQPQTPSTAPSCDDASVKNSLVKALSFATNEEVTALMANFDNADKLGLARRTQERLGQISLDLNNVRADGDACVAEMVAVIPSGDLGHATNHYKATGKPSIDELAQSQGITISEGRIMTTVRYAVADSQATLSETPKALSVIADLMSASAYRMAQGETRVNTNARPAVKVQPAKPTEVARPQPVVREPNLNNSERPSTTEPRETAPATTNETAVATPSTASEPAQEPTTAKEARETPKDKPQPSVPVEKEGEIAIVETDETY